MAQNYRFAFVRVFFLQRRCLCTPQGDNLLDPKLETEKHFLQDTAPSKRELLIFLQINVR
jgi:hypothetical protein